MNGVIRSLPWALYLAVSWTWCIGMYLPTLLVRDHGLLGYAAILVPNAIGAGLVGYVLGKDGGDAARRFIAARRPMVLAFTAVTVAFHGYFIVMIAGPHVWRTAGLEFAAAAIGAASLVMNAAAAAKRVRGLAAGLTLVFTAVFAVALLDMPLVSTDDRSTPLGLIGLAAVCVVGFGLCPYLDVTFNKACIEAPSPRVAFTVGFVLFAVVLTCVTGGRGLWSGGVSGTGIFAKDPWLFAVAAGLHFGGQSAFTIAAHAEAMRTTLDRPLASPAGGLALWGALAVGLIVGALVWPARSVSVGEAGLGEAVYRGFLGFYGLLFPAWLLLTLGRKGGPAIGAVSESTLAWLGAAVVLAGPAYAWATLSGDDSWYLLGVGVVLAIVLARRTRLRG